jgi:hypothetical protein
MDKPPVERKVLHLPIRSHEGPVAVRSVARPWPRQGEWRERVRQLAKAPVNSGSGS